MHLYNIFLSYGALVVITAFLRGQEATPHFGVAPQLWGVPVEGCLKRSWQL